MLTAMLQAGESRIELIEPTAEDSVVGRFLAKRGEGLHHVALGVEDVDAMFERLRARGFGWRAMRCGWERVGTGIFLCIRRVRVGC